MARQLAVGVLKKRYLSILKQILHISFVLGNGLTAWTQLAKVGSVSISGGILELASARDFL